MATILFLVPALNKPSTRLRMLCLKDYFINSAHQTEFREIPKSIGKRLKLLNDVSHYDLVILQKKLFKPLYIKQLAKKCRQLLFDYDDAIMFHEIERNEALTGKFFQHFIETIQQCDAVVAGNHYLANFAKAAIINKKALLSVLPSAIDFKHHQRIDTKKKQTIDLGWIGTKGNVEHLYSIAESLAKAYQGNSNLRLKVLCDQKPEIPGIPIEYIEWRKEDENAQLNTIDIGLMPLKDSIWTQGKGGYKLLQYHALAKASIASPIGINNDIIDTGDNGILARSTEQWTDAILTLAASEEKRKLMGENAYQQVKLNFSLEKYQQDYLKLVGQVLQ